MGNIQFNNNKILFASGIAMDGDCCCDPCLGCSGEVATEYDVTLAAIRDAACDSGSGCTDLNATYRLSSISSCRWRHTFSVPEPTCENTAGQIVYTFTKLDLHLDEGLTWAGTDFVPAVYLHFDYVDSFNSISGTGFYVWDRGHFDPKPNCKMTSLQLHAHRREADAGGFPFGCAMLSVSPPSTATVSYVP